MPDDQPKRPRGRPRKAQEAAGQEVALILYPDDLERIRRAAAPGETRSAVLRRALRALVGDPEG